MTGRILAGSFVLAAVACSGTAPDDVVLDETDSVEVSVLPVEMPAFPISGSGQVAVATSHRQEHYVVDEVLNAWAGKCAGTGLVQVIANTDSYGVVVLLAPPSTELAGMVLPIVEPNDSTPPDSSARVALQIYPEDRAYVLKGVDGTVEIDSVAEFVSGRFSTRVVEATYRDTVFAAASFTDVPIEMVGEEYCRAIDSPPPPIPGEGLQPKPIPVGQAADND